MAAQGYIGRAPGDSSVIVARQTFTPTGITTNFTFASGYTVGYVDAYLNGARLIEGSDYTATDGSVVGLTTHAQNGDVLELVVYKAFNVGDVTGAKNDFSVSNDLNVSGAATVTGAITATGGVVGDVTGDVTGNATGLSGTPDITIRNLTGVAATFTGVVTYDDVTNVDSVGIITARSHVAIADSILHIGDTDTSIRFPAADTFTVETGGSEALRVDSSQNTTFGTTSESSTSVNITASTSGNCLLSFNDTNSGQGGIRYFHSTDHMQFHTADAEKVRITSGGSVGFNTTLTQSSKTVHIAGDYRTSTQNVADEGLIFQSFTTASTGDVYPGISWSGNPSALGRARASINAIATNDNAGSDILFLTRNAADGTELDVNDDEKLRITSAGRIGIGTGTPHAKLEVSGGQNQTANQFTDLVSIAANANNDSIDAEVQLNFGISPSHTDAANRKARIQSVTHAGDARVLTINPDGGNVGIATASPTSVFDVQVNTLAGINFTNQGQSPLLDFRANNVESAGRIRVGENGGGAEMLFHTKKTDDTLTEAFRIDTNQRLLIGTNSARTGYSGNTPEVQIEAAKSSDSVRFGLCNNSNGIQDSQILLAKTRGTSVGSNTVVQDDDVLGRIQFLGADGTDLEVAAQIMSQVDGTPGNNDMPGRLVFSTTPDGASSPVERMRIDRNGTIHMGDRASAGNAAHFSTATVNISKSDDLATSFSKTACFLHIGNASSTLNGIYPIGFGFSTNDRTHLPAYIAYITEDSGAAEHGPLVFATRNVTTDTAPSERMRITSAGDVGVNVTPGGRLAVSTSDNQYALRIDQDHSTAIFQFVEVGNASYAGDGLKMHYTRAGNSAFNFMACDANHGGSADREFTLRGDGNAYADGTWNNNGADYAEFFESSTGAAIPVGTTVVLENNKVRAATSEDSASSIMGVVRPKEPGQASMTIGNSAWNKWTNKYLTDDFDRFILDEHVVYEWTETVEDGDDIFHSYESHQIPEGVTIPSDVVGQTHDSKGNRFVHYRLNPDFDPSVTYVPREERDEWIIVGLIGQVKILDGQPMNDRWVKMRDVSDSVEEWFIR